MSSLNHHVDNLMQLIVYQNSMDEWDFDYLNLVLKHLDKHEVMTDWFV